MIAFKPTHQKVGRRAGWKMSRQDVHREITIEDALETGLMNVFVSIISQALRSPNPKTDELIRP